MAAETLERDFTIVGPGRLWVSNIRGLIDVQPGEDGVIAVTAVKHTDTGDAGRTEILVEQADDGSVHIKTEFRKRWEWLFDWRSPCRVDYTIRVPRDCSVKVRGVSCDIVVQGLAGEFELRTVSGGVRVRDLAGRLAVRGVSGAIRGQGLAGPLEVETVSGDVEFTASRFPSVQATTVSGSLVVETLVDGGPYRFKSVSGCLEVAVPAGSGCTVEMSSVSGRLRTDLPVTREWGHDRQRGAEVQGGGPTIRFSTVSGEMRVRQAAGETAPSSAPATPPPPPPAPPPPPPEPVPPPSPPEPAPPPPPPSTNPRREILDRIARGEISAAQGVEELKKLRQG